MAFPRQSLPPAWLCSVFFLRLDFVPSSFPHCLIAEGGTGLETLSSRPLLPLVSQPIHFPRKLIATIFALLGSFKVFDELVAMGGLYQNDAAEFLSIVFFRYGFAQNKLSLAMTLAVQTFVPLMIIAIFLQFLQRRATAYQD